MNEHLKALFTPEELALAAEIGANTDAGLQARIRDLFSSLADPLLSASDTRDLLGTGEQQQFVDEALASLVESTDLEADESTQRPQDPRGTRLYRLSSADTTRLTLYALEADAGANNPHRYQLTCEGRILRSIARVARLDAYEGAGVQREEIRQHIRGIAEAVKDGSQIQNSVLLVFLEGNVTDADDVEDPEDVPESDLIIRPISDWFEIGSTRGDTLQRVRLVELDMPYRAAAFDREKAALLVDGQQRTAALAEVPLALMPHVPLSVNAVVASEDQAKSIFLAANNTRRIPVDFIQSLLATMGEAPGYLAKEQSRAVATRNLALSIQSSPFYGLVRYKGASPSPDAVVAQNTLFAIVSDFSESSLPFDRQDAGKLAEVVAKAFSFVKETWPDDWGKRPSREWRLMHGACLKALAKLIVSKLDAYCVELDSIDDSAWDRLETSVGHLPNVVAWSSKGAAEGSKTASDHWKSVIADVQNTAKDIKELSIHLRDWSRTADRAAAK